MKITREVILDLLPLYIANELSADTKALVDEYLETDPEIAKIALQEVIPDVMSEIPLSRSKDQNMASLLTAKKMVNQRIVLIAVSITMILAFFGVIFPFLFKAM